MENDRYARKSGYFYEYELAKILKVVPDFRSKVHFDICDLQQYDADAIKKACDTNLYTQIADINLNTMTYLYGGENVRIYRSKKANGHYIYWRYCWGD